MTKTVLIVDSIDARRVAINQALRARHRMTIEVPDAFSAMGALGRHDFGAVVVAEGKRHLTLQSMVSLACKRHKNVGIFVILSSPNSEMALREAFGDRVTLVPPDWGVEQLGTAIEEVVEKVEAKSADEAATDTHGDDQHAETNEGLSLVGSLDGGSGPALLMALFAQELTGCLTVEEIDAPISQLYFFRGEPVWAKPHDGDSGLFQALVRHKVLPTDFEAKPVPEGELLSSLIEMGQISGQDGYAFMRHYMREQVLVLATRTDGRYAFKEDDRFLKYAPLLRVNPFGLIFESRRKRYTPDELIPLGHEMSEKYLWPGPALQIAAPKLSQFSRGKDVSELVDGASTTSNFYTEIGLDMLMGTLMVVTMVESKIAHLRDRPLAEGERVRPLMNLFGSENHLGAKVSSSRSPEEVKRYRVEWETRILETYDRLKTATTPVQVLGVPRFADSADVETSHGNLIALFDEERELSVNDSNICYKIAEMRARVERSFSTLKLQDHAENAPGDLDSNPF